MSASELVELAQRPTAQEKPVDLNTVLASLALIHCDISGALAANLYGDADGFADALANAVIRIANLCGTLGVDLKPVIQRKTQYTTQ